MRTLGRFSLGHFGVAMLLSPVLLSTLCYADPIDFSNVTSLSVTEGSSATLAITVTNNLGAPITTDGLLSFSFLPAQGDPTDDPAPFTTFDPNHTCGSIILANGASCSIDFIIQTDSIVGETDFDSGSNVLSLTWGYQAPGGGAHIQVPDPNGITITVNDPAPVPEPASSMVFGLATAAACVLFRRRLPNRNQVSLISRAVAQ